METIVLTAFVVRSINVILLSEKWHGFKYQKYVSATSPSDDGVMTADLLPFSIGRQQKCDVFLPGIAPTAVVASVVGRYG